MSTNIDQLRVRIEALEKHKDDKTQRIMNLEALIARNYRVTEVLNGKCTKLEDRVALLEKKTKRPRIKKSSASTIPEVKLPALVNLNEAGDNTRRRWWQFWK